MNFNFKLVLFLFQVRGVVEMLVNYFLALPGQW